MSSQDFLIHVNLVARKEWIEREKEKEKVKFPFKNGRWEENKGERGKRKINLLELNFSPKSSLWLKSRKGKGENQSNKLLLEQLQQLDFLIFPFHFLAIKEI